jgi:hypothetical protein
MLFNLLMRSDPKDFQFKTDYLSSNYNFSYTSNSEDNEIDLAEQIESVAYVLCGEGLITFEKFCKIWQAKGVSTKLNTLNSVEKSMKHLFSHRLWTNYTE